MKNWLVLCGFAAFVLSACQTTLITDWLTQPADVLYHDDFSDSSGNWPNFSLPEGAAGYLDGAYSISVEAKNYQLWAVSQQLYRDAVIDVDATYRAGPPANLFGVICRYQDAHNFYFFIISSDGYFAIGKRKDGKASLLGQEMMAYSGQIVQGDGTNHLTFSCIQDTLTGAVNGHVVALTQDQDFVVGDAGLLAGSLDEGGVAVIFDNFVVSNP
jgi:hypothetical protein